MRRKLSPIRRILLAGTLAFCSVFTPQVESISRAETRSTRLKNAAGECEIEERYTGLRLSEKGVEKEAHLVYPHDPLSHTPKIRCTSAGSRARLRLEFYPFLGVKKGNAEEHPIEVYVLENGEYKTYTGKTRGSEAVLIDKQGIVPGYKAGERIKVGESTFGSRVHIDGGDILIPFEGILIFSILTPGLFQIGIEELPPPEPTPQRQQPGPAAAGPGIEPEPPPLQVRRTSPKREYPEIAPLILIPDASSRFFGRIQIADVQRELGSGLHRIGMQHLGFLLGLKKGFFAGVQGTHQTAELNPQERIPSEPHLRVLSGGGSAGYAHRFGKLQLFLRAQGNVMHAKPQVMQGQEDITTSDTKLGAIVGGELALTWGEHGAVRVEGANDPLIPLQTQAMLEFGRLRVSGNLLWLRLLTQEQDGREVEHTPTHNLAIARAMAQWEILKKGKWLLGLTGGAEMDIGLYPSLHPIGGACSMVDSSTLACTRLHRTAHPLGGVVIGFPFLGPHARLSLLGSSDGQLALQLALGGSPGPVRYDGEFFQFPFSGDEFTREGDLRLNAGRR